MNPKNNQKQVKTGSAAASPVRRQAGPPRGRSLVTSTGRNVSRGAAIRAQKRTVQDANRVASQYLDASTSGGEQPQPRRANIINDNPRLKITGLGGMDEGGAKNMMVIEYANDAIVKIGRASCRERV